jgi:predicted regulator of Ras-like GTPase activity (Roadblock/LC7/MglB family)
MTVAKFHPDQRLDELLVVSDPNGAPIIHVDGAPVFGQVHGVVHVTVAAQRVLFNRGEASIDYVATGFLRMSVAAAAELRDALEQAILISQRPQGAG